MIQVSVTRNLIGLEDLLTGVGTVQQIRGAGTETTEITRINAQNLPYDGVISLADKLQELEDLANSLSVVDESGNFLTGYLNTSDAALNLDGRLWRRTPTGSPGVAELYYGSVRVLQYNETTGDLILPPETDYIAADAALKIEVEAYTDAEVGAVADDLTTLSNSLGTAAFIDVGTGNNQILRLDGTAKIPAVDGSQLTNLPDKTPVGQITITAANTPDTGYLECNGSAVSRATYASLFTRIGTTFGAGDGSTTFNLPDLRGEFVRGWDNGRNIDTGRAFGSFQADELKAHSHSYSAGLVGASAGMGGSTRYSSGSYTTGTTGGAETRPRNIALMYQIKAVA